jgi:RNA polymerase sigma factor (sigma-70 family)
MEDLSQSILGCLRSMFSHQRFAALRDSTLLRLFVRSGDSDAFVTLMRRHGPMVLGLARRIVRDRHLAEDVFQATFLILARKASALQKRESLPAWLHSVALRLAWRAKKKYKRSAAIEALARTSQSVDPLEQISAREFLAILDEELNRLPEKYRLPLILCHLQGLTQEVAAKRLNVGEGSLKGMLERGRAMLRARLASRGLDDGPPSCGLLLIPPLVPPVLVQSTLRAAVVGQGASASAAALTKGMVMTMMLAQFRTVCFALILLGGAGWGASRLALSGESDVAAVQSESSQLNVEASKVSAQPKEKRVDLYGDPLPEGAVMRLGTLKLREAGSELALTSDGKTLVALRGDKYVHFWDVESGELKEKKEITAGSGFGRVLSPDGKWLAVPAKSGVQLFDVQTGMLAHELATKTVKAGSPRPLVFSQDGKYLASSWATGKQIQLRVWDVATQEEAFDQEIARDNLESVMAIFFAPDGTKLLANFTTSKLGTICWDFASGKQLWQLTKGGPGSDRAIFLGKEKLLSSGGVLDIATGQSVKRDKALPIDSLSYFVSSIDGKTLFISGARGVTVWDVEAAKEVRLLEGAGEIMVLAPDGKSLITSNGALQRWDLATGKALYADNFDDGHTQEVTALVFSADAKRMASGSGDGSVRLWDIEKGQAIHVWRGHEVRRPVNITRWISAGVQALAITSDGRRVVSAGSEARLRAWDGVNGNELWAAPFPKLPPNQLEPRLQHLRVTPDGTNVTGLVGATQFFRRADEPFSPASPQFGTWDLEKGALLSQAPMRSYSLQSPLSQDGRFLVGSSVVEFLSGKEVTKLTVAGGSATSPLDISRDGSLIAGAAQQEEKKEKVTYVTGVGFRVWEKTTGKVVAKLETERWNKGKLLFHPKSRFVVVSGSKGIDLWDILKEEIVASFALPEPIRLRNNPNTFTSCLAFSSDGRQLATGQVDGTILLWKIDLPSVKRSPLEAQEVEALWADLKDDDAAKAWKAIWRLVDAPEDAIPFLRQKLKPFASAPPEITKPLLTDLGSDDFVKRDVASKRLKELGLLAERSLQDMLQTNPPLEVRQRIQALLKSLAEAPQPLTPEALQDIRAVAVLARIPSPQARQILEDLTHGAESARLTVEAKAALAAW